MRANVYTDRIVEGFSHVSGLCERNVNHEFHDEIATASNENAGKPGKQSLL